MKNSDMSTQDWEKECGNCGGGVEEGKCLKGCFQDIPDHPYCEHEAMAKALENCNHPFCGSCGKTFDTSPDKLQTRVKELETQIKAVREKIKTIPEDGMSMLSRNESCSSVIWHIDKILDDPKPPKTPCKECEGLKAHIFAVAEFLNKAWHDTEFFLQQVGPEPTTTAKVQRFIEGVQDKLGVTYDGDGKPEILTAAIKE